MSPLSIPGRDRVVPDQEHSGIVDQTERQDGTAYCLITEGMKRCVMQPVNYDTVNRDHSGKGREPASFLGWLTEAFRKYMSTDPDC